MKKTFTNLCSKALGGAIKGVGKFSVNSTCLLGLGQVKEPKTLSKYKKIRDK